MGKKISLVLSGGGARGLAHIGVIEELEKRGYEIVSIAGTSMGAFIGGIYALGKLEEFKKWALTFDKIKLFDIIDFSFNRQGLIKGVRVFNIIKKFIPDKNIEELNIPYVATAVDLLTNQEYVFTEGSLYTAIRASISIPTVFTPVSYNGCMLVDGGLMDNIPTKNIKRVKGDMLVAVDVNAFVPLEKPPFTKEKKKQLAQTNKKNILFFKSFLKSKGKAEKEVFNYFEIINKSIMLMTQQIAIDAMKKCPPDLLIQISHNAASTFDFLKTEELIELGRYATAKELDKIKPKKIGLFG